MARSMFNGCLDLGEERLDIKLYAAVERGGMSFRLLHEPDRQPVEQRMVHPKTNETVPKEQIRRGLELPDGTVSFEDAELNEFEAGKDKTLEVHSFVSADLVDTAWFDRPYYIAPVDAVRHEYAALCAAMEATQRVGLVRWAMRKREYNGVLLQRDGHLVLLSLRPAESMIDLAAIDTPKWKKASDKERKMARTLVEMLEGELAPEQMQDEYSARVLEYIEAKHAGRVESLPAPIQKAPSDDDLGDALEACIKAVKERGVA